MENEGLFSSRQKSIVFFDPQIVQELQVQRAEADTNAGRSPSPLGHNKGFQIRAIFIPIINIFLLLLFPLPKKNFFVRAWADDIFLLLNFLTVPYQM